ncbi:hypothetical protein [Chitinophaga filiformis]|uniref:Uncharacterized protein n=1 Tax=Chitinophaga filiformis TaxID=104663 RepID=A0A1G7JKZ8_CHIFI|nr:hypothetical protein [Chitinophaga filiformis]SDF25617.1 hypothetical protein SAMN04488121_1011280 [Chitinophaga filiformis]
MLSEKETRKEKPSEESKQIEQHPVEILKTEKADNSRNPLHADLSEEPEEENAAVRDQDTKKTK